MLWLIEWKAFWEAAFDRLEQYLARLTETGRD
jgi:hypothetical protein